MMRYFVCPTDLTGAGFVMGRNGQTLRTMEEEWGVLMFFAKLDGSDAAKARDNGEDAESLCIFGPLAARRGAPFFPRLASPRLPSLPETRQKFLKARS